MRQYYSNNKNYNAILESMAQIRQNQLNEQHGYFVEAEHEDEEMQEGMHGDEEEMEEGMYEGEHEDEEDAQMEALAEMMDEALMELDQDDDNDQMLGEEEEDGERRARRRARLRNALLIGAGLVATGGLAGAAMASPAFRQGLGTAAMGAKDLVGDMIKEPGTTARKVYSSIPGVPSLHGSVQGQAKDFLDAANAMRGVDVGAPDYDRMVKPDQSNYSSSPYADFSRGYQGARARRGSSQQMVIDREALKRAAAIDKATRFGADIPGGM